jgi:hypothetical protein
MAIGRNRKFLLEQFSMLEKRNDAINYDTAKFILEGMLRSQGI